MFVAQPATDCKPASSRMLWSGPLVKLGGSLAGFIQRQRRGRGRIGQDVGCPAGGGLRAGVFQDGLIRTLAEAGWIVDGGNRDGEGLWGAGVDAAVGRPAVVVQ